MKSKIIFHNSDTNNGFLLIHNFKTIRLIWSFIGIKLSLQNLCLMINLLR